MSKTCSPGSFPEGKVGDSGRTAGRWIVNIMFSVPEPALGIEPKSLGAVLGRGGGTHYFLKNNRPAVRKLPGRVSGRENEKSCVWWAMAQGPNQPALLAPHTGPSTLTFLCLLSWSLSPPKGNQSRKNTESRKVPGRESRGFQKDCRKDCRKQHRDKRINNNLHIYIYIYINIYYIFPG